MSFGAMAAWQAWALIFAAAAVAVWLFRLKVRPPRIAVPSLLLWRKVFDHDREVTWWERVRRAVSLVATVLLAAALAVAVGRPGPGIAASARGRTVIVLDSSWSMAAATPGGQSRWDRALRQARVLAAGAGGDEVALATTADGLVEGPTTDLALIETAIDQLQPSGGAGAAWPRIGGAQVVHFVTDGAVARPLDADVVVHSVFEPAPNVAITAFDVRPAPTPAADAEAYLEIANYASETQQVRITVRRGATVVSENTVEMAAGEAVRQTIPLGVGDARIEARVSASLNALPTDDRALAWLTSAEPLAVTVVSPEPGPLASLLRGQVGLRVTFQAPDGYDPVGADVLVFDRWLPSLAPGRPALILSPPAAAWLGTPGDTEREPQWTTSDPHDVLTGVDTSTIDIERVRAYSGPTLAPIARSATDTPLVLVDDQVARRFVVVTLSVADSNFGLAPAYPVLIGNALEWLSRPAFDVRSSPGSVTLPLSTTRVTAPDGTEVPLLRAGTFQMATLPAPGLYLVETGGARSVLGVNVGDPEVSNLQRTTLDDSASALVGSQFGAGRPWWIYCVALAFGLALVEWWTWQRRITV